MANNNVTAILESGSGSLWVGTNGGLNELVFQNDQEGQILHSYTSGNGLSDIMLKALAEDRDGNLWVGSDTGGAMKIARHGLITYENNGLAAHIINLRSQSGDSVS